MLTLSKPDFKRQERNRQRLFANDLIDALRGRIPYPQVYLSNVGEEIEREAKASAPFTVRGAHRTTLWSKGDYIALVLSPNYAEADGATYRVVLFEPDFERVRDRLSAKGIACGKEHFSLRGSPPRAYPCEMCELLYRRAAVYQLQDGEMVRNRMSVTRTQAAIADMLLEAARVGKVVPSAN